MSARAEPERHAFTIGDGEASRLDTRIAARLGLSRTQAATLIATGQVHVAGRREKASYRPVTGDLVEVVVPPPAPRTIEGEAIPLTVVHEDEWLVVVDKPAGMVVHPAPGNWTGTLVNALLGRGGPWSEAGGAERPGLVHRLDKDTSGLLLIAKDDRTHRLLSAALAERHIARRYAAVIWGHLDQPALTVDRPIARDPRDRQRMAIVRDGKPARTTFTRLARFDAGDLLRARLHTGRTHQIRVHLASIGHPVLGDDTYGGGGARRLVGLSAHRHFLHAAWLRFRHPATGADMDLRAPLPADLRAALAVLAPDMPPPDGGDPLDAFAFFEEGDGPG